jgi:rhodanese-related sulfurtransferase
VGGLLLGMGFVVSGYCPGTAVVATASGYMDGVLSLIGVMVGALVFGFAWPLLEGFYGSTSLGVVTLPKLLGVPWAVLALAVVAMAVGAFLVAERVERALAAKDQIAPPVGDPPTRNRVLGGLAATAALAILALAVPAEDAASAAAPVDATSIAPVELGLLLSGGTSEVYLLDVRPTAECEAERIPGAICLPAEDLDAAFVASLPPTRPLVVYGGGAEALVPTGARGFGGTLKGVEGGFAAWQAQVMTAPTPPESPTPEAVAAYRTRAALHAHFTGAAVAAPPVEFKPTAVTRTVKKGGGC